MTSLEDKLLGEKAHNYCSSSESEEEVSDQENKGTQSTASSVTVPGPYKWEGSSTNTGPKGVVKDWQRFKQLETENREKQEREKLALLEKLSLTCKSVLDEEREKNNQLDPEIAELLNDDFLLEYQKKRMQEMLSEVSSLPKFGKVFTLSDTQEFLDAIDKENKSVTIIVHLFEYSIKACEAMNGCFKVLCQEYPQVKFCALQASIAGLSKHFKISGLPALLVYKNGQVVGNFVRVSDDLGDDFFAVDVESFLLEHGMLPDKTCIPAIIQTQDNTDDSD